MQTDAPPGSQKCNCRRGMIIIFTLFMMAVSASACVLVLLDRSIG